MIPGGEFQKGGNPRLMGASADAINEASLDHRGASLVA
jgi:hypothetical protein